MPDYRQPVQEYIRACEALLKIGELSKEEAEVVEECLVRLPINFLTMSAGANQLQREVLYVDRKTHSNPPRR